LAKGWAPTFIGYGVQGAAKFGFYEYFKHTYGGFFSKEDAVKYKASDHNTPKRLIKFERLSVVLIGSNWASVFRCPIVC
jgi:hypothetical protein